MKDVDKLKEAIKKICLNPGTWLLEIKLALGARSDLGRPKISPTQNKFDVIEFLGAE